MGIIAVLLEKNREMIIRKKCAKHGVIEDFYWQDAEKLKQGIKYVDTGGILINPDVKKSVKEIDCPMDCGLCARHKAHTALANLAVTNRCPLSCWYCFFYAKEGEAIYEPSLAQIRNMCKNLRNERPIAPNAIQLTGGEPSVRDDLLDIIRICKEEGFEHVQLNTYGKSFAYDLELTKKVMLNGANVIYMSFDGVSEKTNPKNYWEVPAALDNVSQAIKSSVVLVPTVIAGINDHELGDILRFAAANLHVVRGINFQPVSFVGRMPKKLRDMQRITIPKAIELIEAQTNGQITKDDFFTVPCVSKISHFIEAFSGRPQYTFSNHFACGAATYVFMDGKRFLPLPQFFDVEGFFEYLEGLTEELNKSKIKSVGKIITAGKLLIKINSFIDKEKAPERLDFGKLLAEAIINKSYDGLKRFHYNSLFVGLMHFMDLYNYDVDRVERCNIHYAMPNNMIVPFCAYNVIPSYYRDKVQREYSINAKEFEKKTKHKISEDKWAVVPTEEKKGKIRERYRVDIAKFK